MTLALCFVYVVLQFFGKEETMTGVPLFSCSALKCSYFVLCANPKKLVANPRVCRFLECFNSLPNCAGGTCIP